jgi:hypothetical protein
MEGRMHATIRTYSGTGAEALFDLIEQRQEEVDKLMRSIPGFISYTLVRTADGGATVTVCSDKNGTDEGARIAREWISSNAVEIGAPSPNTSEGEVRLHLT